MLFKSLLFIYFSVLFCDSLSVTSDVFRFVVFNYETTYSCTKPWESTWCTLGVLPRVSDRNLTLFQHVHY